MVLTPAYGRDYKSKKAAIADFDANKDFIVADFFSPWDGKPVNREQLIGKHKEVNIRYDKHRKVCVVRL